MDDEQLLLRCHCGGFDFLDVGVFYFTDPDDAIYYVALVQEPRTFWNKLKMLFRRESYAREILLTKSQMEAIKTMLEKHLGT